MVAFLIHPPPDLMDKIRLEMFMKETDGFIGFDKADDRKCWIAMFESAEQATTAQWLLELNGAKGR